jgi:hypothetical protein
MLGDALPSFESDLPTQRTRNQWLLHHVGVRFQHQHFPNLRHFFNPGCVLGGAAQESLICPTGNTKVVITGNIMRIYRNSGCLIYSQSSIILLVYRCDFMSQFQSHQTSMNCCLYPYFNCFNRFHRWPKFYAVIFPMLFPIGTQSITLSTISDHVLMKWSFESHMC